ncbi:SPOSA6832_03424, partial [Sporobolomyces salmonicolor]
MASRVTRSASRAASISAPVAEPSTSPVKRSISSPSTPRKRTKQPAAPASPYVPPTPQTAEAIVRLARRAEEEAEQDGAALKAPELKFKYEDAKRHLISVDARWGVIMNKLKCKPFEGEQNDPFNPFKSLVSSILGQQVSWLAARTIQHRFVRLFFPHLPEKLPPPDATEPRLDTPFPTPHQVVALGPDRTAALRSAGLSGRKTEYVIELAERFVDGRLDARKLWEMDDEEVTKTLTEVRGIGVCKSLASCQLRLIQRLIPLRHSPAGTCQMLQIFALKRGDILPVGDLGIQKNLARWYSQDPSLAPSIHPRKLAAPSPTKLASSSSAQVPPSPSPSPSKRSREVINGDSTSADTSQTPSAETGQQELIFDSAALPSGDKDGNGSGVGKLAALGGADVAADDVIDLAEPAATVNGGAADEMGAKEEEKDVRLEGGGFRFPETSNGLTPAILKSRLSGKKIKGNYLLPKEMEELTAPWRPYRSVAMWYLWSLTDAQ